jgi:Skp family chaperone for outer membrane proteins
MASLVATGYCGECGIHFDAATQRQELIQRRNALDLEISTTKAALDAKKHHLEDDLGNERGTAHRLRSERDTIGMGPNIFWGAIFGGLAVLFVLMALSSRDGAPALIVAGIFAALVVVVIFNARAKTATKARLENEIGLQEGRVAQKEQEIAAAVQSAESRIAELRSQQERAAGEYEELGGARGRPASVGPMV